MKRFAQPSIKRKRECIFIDDSNINFNFKVDKSMISPKEIEGIYNQMSNLTKDFHTQVMT